MAQLGSTLINGTLSVTGKINGTVANAEKLADKQVEAFLLQDALKDIDSTKQAVGGLPAGTDISAMTVSQILNQILNPTPMTKPTLSLTNSISSTTLTKEYGQTYTIAANSTIATISRDEGTATNISAYSPTSGYTISDSNLLKTEAVTLTAGNNTTLSYSVSCTYDITDTVGKKLTGQLLSASKSLLLTVTYPFYIGYATSAPTVANITDVTANSNLTGITVTNRTAYTNKKPSTVTINVTDAIPVIVSAVKLSAMKDPNNADVLGTYILTTKTVKLNGKDITYYFYVRAGKISIPNVTYTLS